MTLEHAETVENPPKISAQSLALAGALFYGEKDGQEDVSASPALTETDLARGGLSGFDSQ